MDDIKKSPRKTYFIKGKVVTTKKFVKPPKIRKITRLLPAKPPERADLYDDFLKMLLKKKVEHRVRFELT